MVNRLIIPLESVSNFHRRQKQAFIKKNILPQELLTEHIHPYNRIRFEAENSYIEFEYEGMDHKENEVLFHLGDCISKM